MAGINIFGVLRAGGPWSQVTNSWNFACICGRHLQRWVLQLLLLKCWKLVLVSLLIASVMSLLQCHLGISLAVVLSGLKQPHLKIPPTDTGETSGICNLRPRPSSPDTVYMWRHCMVKVLTAIQCTLSNVFVCAFSWVIKASLRPKNLVIMCHFF